MPKEKTEKMEKSAGSGDTAFTHKIYRVTKSFNDGQQGDLRVLAGTVVTPLDFDRDVWKVLIELKCVEEVKP
jgi:hypothetical protein